MKYPILKTNCILAAAIAGLFLSFQASADKPTWVGSGKNEEQQEGKKGKQRHEGERDGDRHEGKRSKQRHEGERRQGSSVEVDIKIGSYFDGRRREAVHDYYHEQFRSGNCPPGLAKKKNGCMPPGQAKKWSVGKPLPQGVEYHDVPADVVVKIGQPPAGHRYVQVAADILLMAVGTGMIVDAIEDLGRKR
ncbi:MAG: DUF1236 domain-containing protein [Gallionellaceae bacterium]|nr:DUF1236 domain-containing protein [Gallionellaceae bacterium]